MNFAYNPKIDSGFVKNGYKWDTRLISVQGKKKSELRKEFLDFAIREVETIKTARVGKIDVPLSFSPTCSKCVLYYMDGEYKEVNWNYFYSRKQLVIGSCAFSKYRFSEVEYILLYDSFLYHPSMLRFWSETGFSMLDALDEMENLKKSIICCRTNCVA